MSVTPVEKLFAVLNETADILKEELSCTYLDALAETGENLFHGTILQEELSEITQKRLEKVYKDINLSGFSSEQIRKAYQLAILKGMQENVQPNHQMTPDAVGMFIGYLVNRFIGQGSYRLLDPAVGTGNLLSAVLNQQPDKTITSIGIEIDDLLIKLAYTNANLQQHGVQFFNQDSLEPLFVDPVDAVVCDLPVGYYPNDVRAAEYEIRAEHGHTYAHHLFIEQGTRHLKPGGYLFFIIPNGLFESEQSPQLHDFIKKHLNMQAVLQLPRSLFKSEHAAKSILIAQKKGENIKAPKQALLAQLPKLSNGPAMENIIQKIDTWIAENKG
ncbi:class I SAM-dependent methyltransferase [Bacillus sp. T33-2]|uniref:class I SAM-dependent methyltransferase n=1 Tax=Bacillus sp. T33-2 TaxID=2054168 RepID=UPI000C757424|nr:class I SAM-dependent methyltransferase [Bacillus sp. T33-2]PLR98273.1 SAM-dependent methyltransferase [Bacillus sp. T33-2]